MIFGAIVGDVVGSPYEFNNIKTKNFPLVTDESFLTDDSIMTLAIADALMKFPKGSEIDGAEFERAVTESMRRFGRRYPHRGYGGMFLSWLESPDPKPYNSWGNGSAMRVSPVAWYFDDLPTVEKFAELSALPTHNHPEGIKGAQATASAVFLARTGKSKDEIRSYISLRYGYNLQRTCDEIRPVYKFDGSCQGTVPEGIIAFLESNSFEDAIRNAISLGGDSDTLAAVTGAVAEAFYGVPEEIETLILPLLDDSMKFELERWRKTLSGETDSGKSDKNGATDMIFILDRSGSMSGLEADTIGGFNSMIDRQKKESGNAFVSTILFDHVQEVLHNRVNLADVKPMTRTEYFTRGSTALLDAVGRAIRYTVNAYRHMKPTDVPGKTIFVIITDGYENASREYSYNDVKRMIEHEKEKYGWEFLFIGANIDAVEAASSIGISADRAVDYVADSQGTEVVYDGVAEAVCCMSMCEEPSEFLSRGEWRAKIDEDYSTRFHGGKNHRDNTNTDDDPEILSLFEDETDEK
ncbi:MAG: ADP-ribosylglycohydrolase family protein [Synergistaceae bacterium]|nr:ADP-ribosylglycohydrolase family protein [Synergistaceae bacterium]